MCNKDEYTIRNGQEHIKDYKLQHLLKQKIAQSEDDKALLRNVFLCCDRVARTDQFSDVIFTISNGHQAKYSGVLYCHNPWVCPVCSATQMSKWATDITCAIEALKKTNQIPIMITFTIPHVKWFTCKDSMEILIKTFEEFIYRGKKVIKPTRINKQNKVVSNKRKDPWNLFTVANNVNHHVKVMEHTWCYENGWHPHYHSLIWIDKDKLSSVGNSEQELRLRWLHLAKKHALKIITKNYKTILPEKELQERLTILEKYYNNKISMIKHYHENPHQFKSIELSLKISRDKNNNVIEMKSGQYICGWGADTELTNQRHKTAYKSEFSEKLNHYSPYEMLTMAKEFIEKEDYKSADNWLNLFMEYARATRKPRRKKVTLSQSGLRKIINDYKQTNEYKQYLKKKFIGDAKTQADMWYPVFWFNKQQWYEICSLELQYQTSIRAKILKLAIQEECSWILLKTLIEQYDTKLAESIYNNFIRFQTNGNYAKYIILAATNRIREFTKPLQIIYESQAA